ncbi:hypothetical protein JYT85_01425 [Desulfocapsa sp. AH-315-G09]|uniref:Uncharacterized protein n=1 Tax=Desulfotalea psychrophila TaxID=84980 RepID=A0ABS3AYB2_9BACT|nr:hypothetical protein [Desulfocapsa sp.]MBN4065288.1 hypothetical protein [Desulfocapsa sp. AH-315-G09]MBN4068867.1 hypothetical protein [Desulfotalea psychrophila]
MKKIESSELSKSALVDIVDAIRESKIVPDSLILKLYKHDLASQLLSIEKQLEAIKVKLKNKKLSRKAYQALAKKSNQLVLLANRKAQIYNGLED